MSRIHLVNPSCTAFGTAVITPRWLYVLAGATPAGYGDPILVDETLEQSSTRRRSSRATSSASASTPPTPCAATRSGARPRERGARAWSSAAFTRACTPTKRTTLGGAHAVVTGDGDGVWPTVLADCAGRHAGERVYDGGKVRGDALRRRRAGTCCRRNRYMWASVQTVRGCPKHCSFCSVWRTDGQEPRTRTADAVVERSRRTAAAGLPLHRAGRRQLLPGDAERPGHGGAAGRSARAARR